MSEGRFDAANELRFLSGRSVGLRLEWTFWAIPGDHFSMARVSSAVADKMKELFQNDLSANSGILHLPSRDVWGLSADVLEEYCRQVASVFRAISAGQRVSVADITRLAVFEAFGFMLFSGADPGCALEACPLTRRSSGTFLTSLQLVKALGFSETDPECPWIDNSRVHVPDSIMSPDFVPSEAVKSLVLDLVERYAARVLTEDFRSHPAWALRLERWGAVGQ